MTIVEEQIRQARIWHRGVAETPVLGVKLEVLNTEEDFVLGLDEVDLHHVEGIRL